MRTIPQNESGAALYLRLSREEEAKQESNSITNQRRILTEYANDNKIKIFSEYVDDGVTGTNYDRAGFQNMMEDIKAGKVNAVIVKDLSRLGRNHNQTDRLIEEVFPDSGVRFISIGEGYDSHDGDEISADILPYLNIHNEWHAKQTSRKCRAAKKSMAKAGKFMGSKAPFGYIRDPADKYHLLIDPEAAETVRLIFQLACDGFGYKAIGRQLREQRLPNPTAYINAKDPDHHQNSEYWKQPHDWHATSIKTILSNPTYLGKVVSGRRSTKSFKNKDIIIMPEDDWIVVPGMHEAIIDQRMWDTAQEKLRVRKRCDNHGAMQIFAGLVRCADCGYALAFTRHGGKMRYQCSNYNVKGKNYCTSHHISYEELYGAVLHDIRRRAKAAAGMDKQMLRALKREASGTLDKKLRQAEKDFKNIGSRVAELDTIIGRLYEDGALGRISTERYDMLVKKYEGEQLELKKKHAEVQRELAEQQKRHSESEQFMTLIAAYHDITKLNAPILNELISSIEVGAIETRDGVKHRKIRIRYRQFCYVELFGLDGLFKNWSEESRAELREIDAELDRRTTEFEKEWQEHGGHYAPNMQTIG